MDDKQVMVEEARAKAAIYHFLAAVFSVHPTLESLQGIRSMAETLGIDCKQNFSLKELEQEYMELFVIPNPRYLAPYESVFRDRWLLPGSSGSGSASVGKKRKIKGLVMGESTVAVRETYLQMGLRSEEELPDHIGTELRFLAYLWEKEAEPAKEETMKLSGLRKTFLEEHPLKWISQLRERVQESDHLGYYQAAVEVAEAVLQNDANGN